MTSVLKRAADFSAGRKCLR